MRETDLAWLAGVIDGEGTMGIYRQNPTKKGKTPSIIVNLHISNTDARIINRCATICFQITGKEQNVCYMGYNRQDSHGSHYQLKIASQKNILAVLNAIKPYLVGKVDQAELIVSVLDSRKLFDKWSTNIDNQIALLKNMKRFLADDTVPSPSTGGKV